MFIAGSISKFNRIRKYKLFLELLNPTEKDSILDIGFNNVEYSDVDNYLEKNYPFPENITALGIKDFDEFEKRYPKVKVIKYDGNDFPFEDKSFKICWSNAVLEHVGDKEKQIGFIKEIKRVSEIAFITTPNKHFPVEVHTRTFFLHFLPKKLFDKYLELIGKKWATGDYMHLLSKSDIKKLLKKAGIDDYTIINNYLTCFPIDFIIIFGEKVSKNSKEEFSVNIVKNIRNTVYHMLEQNKVKK